MPANKTFYDIAAVASFIGWMIVNGVMASREASFDWKHGVIVGLLVAIYCVARSIQESMK